MENLTGLMETNKDNINELNRCYCFWLYSCTFVMKKCSPLFFAFNSPRTLLPWPRKVALTAATWTERDPGHSDPKRFQRSESCWVSQNVTKKANIVLTWNKVLKIRIQRAGLVKMILKRFMFMQESNCHVYNIFFVTIYMVYR